MTERESLSANDGLLLPAIRIETAKSPEWSVVWLHGLGADGHDFEPIVPHLRLKSPMRFIFPHAPRQPVTINGTAILRMRDGLIVEHWGGPHCQDGVGLTH